MSKNFSDTISKFKSNPFMIQLAVAVFIFSLQYTIAQEDTTAIQDTTTQIFTPLSGALPSVLKVDNSPYVVEADIYVSPGTTVSIDSGVVLLFNNFSGLHVQGTLYAKGTPERPIVFTSQNDTYYNPYASISAAPYDWNGIDIYEDAIGTYFENCLLQYSVYGIRSQTEYFKVRDCRFLQNGKSNISIMQTVLDVDSSPFSYSKTEETPLTLPSTEPEPAPQTPPLVTERTDNHHSFAKVLRYSGAVVAVGGITAAVWRFQKYRDAKDEYEMISQNNDFNKKNYTSKDWEKSRDNYKKESALTSIYTGIGLLGLLSFGLSFTF